jgi:hypothetical protein
MLEQRPQDDRSPARLVEQPRARGVRPLDRRGRPLAFAIVVALALAALVAVAGANHSQTVRVSAGQINGNGVFGAEFTGASANGSRVFYESREKLARGDSDSAKDVFEAQVVP